MPEDCEALRTRFRADQRLGPALQLVFMRASGRVLDRFSAIPKTLLHHIGRELGAGSANIASLRSIYRRRETLYDHQRWARERLGLQSFEVAVRTELQQELKVQASAAASV